MQKEYLSAAAEVLSDQGVDENLGLSNDEASSRLAKTGPNKLEEAEKTPLWKRFFEQMADPMVIMLIVAAVISALTGMVKGEADFADVAIIMFVVIVNSVLGVVQEAKSEEALEALQEMSAAQSKVLRDGKLVHLPSAELVPGDVIMLEAGDSVPADCRVLESATMKIEEAALTGESVPVEKHANVIELAAGTDDVPLGDRKNMCYMGSTVVYGRGRAVVVGTGMNTEMGKIAGALAEAKEELTPLQVKLAELSRILTIMVIIICVVIFGVDILRHGVGNVLTDPTALLDTFMVAVSLAVAAIPEGLVAVVTIVLSLGVTKMAKRQAIIRKLSAVETLGCTQTICSDKTGTLTQGTFKVVGIHPENGVTGDALVEAAALAESWSKHPISLSIKAAYGKPIDAARVTDVQELGGHGVTAKVDGKSVAAGNARLMEKLGLAVPAVEGVGTIVHVAVEGSYAGYLLIADVVKPHSADAIRALKASGVRKTVMLTGDAQPVAQAVAQQLGLDEYHAGLLPGDKVDQIEKLLAAKQPKENLAFVGDGINDAPVLSRADVGIAMGALGSDAAIEAADVVLMDDDPAKIALAMRIARRTLRIVHQNIVFALGIKALCLLLGALGIAGMWAAIFADVGVMVIAVLNATRALYTKDLTKN